MSSRPRNTITADNAYELDLLAGASAPVMAHCEIATGH